MGSTAVYLSGGGSGMRPPAVHSLPTELLSYIFELVTHALSQAERDTLGVGQRRIPFHPNSIRAPISLSAVSRRWRCVALSTPALWTSLFVSLDNVIECFPGQRRTILDAESLAYFLIRSRNCTLDIFIDGRDPEWEFSDHLDGNEADGRPPAQHPFDPQVMNQILNILGHHIHRWRSLTVFSDTWAPMRVAICCLSLPRVDKGSFFNSRRGASCLETLTLMLCNEYIARGESFGPQIEEPIATPFSALTGHPDGSYSPTPLSRLRSVSLFGVHVNWTDFAHFISGTCGSFSKGIENLELSYHTCDVRPDVTEFCGILEACAWLRTLTLKMSGPQWVGGASQGPPVTLPHLEKLHLMFDSAEEAALTLSLLRCPSLTALILEDGDIPTDASPLLYYCGTGSLCTPPRRGDDPCCSDLACSPRTDFGRKLPFFPSIQELVLDQVSARCLMPYALLLAGLPNLRRLALRHIPTYAFASLLPRQLFCDSQRAPEVRMSIPCTHLEYIEATHTEEEAYHKLSSILREREKLGAPRIPAVTFSLEGGYCSTVGLAHEEITHLEVAIASAESTEIADC